VIAPFAAFTGSRLADDPLAAMARDLTAGRLEPDALIDWKVESCRTFKERLGPAVNLVTTIWPRWFVVGSPEPRPGLPRRRRRRAARGS
jgi:hypothetical protein